jgi:hypothetical protein
MTADTAGPNKKSRRGNRYTHVVVLDKHAYGEVDFGKHKSEASDHIRDNYPLWCRDSKGVDRPSILKTDRGGEYRSTSFEQWCAKKGIRHKLTAPNSSAGSAEKKIDTLQNLARAMMNDAGAPNFLWCEATQHANTVTLFVPSASKKLQGLAPYESRWQTRPPVHKLHRWGCQAFANLPRSQRGRQDNKSREGMFIGLCKDRSDGYRFFDADKNSIFTSRSAIFHDNIMYYDQKKKRALMKGEPKRKKEVRFEGEGEDLYDNEMSRTNSSDPPPQALEERKTTMNKRRKTQRAHFDLHLFDEAYKHDKEQAAKDEAAYTTTASRLPSGQIPEGPDAFNVAVNSEDRVLWLEAIAKERKSIKDREVMKPIKRSEIPNGRRTIKAKWVFDIKRNADGSVGVYKARLVAKGFLQQYGRDFLDTFAPTPSFTSIRLLAATALQKKWDVDHLDVKTAFLYGELEEWERVYLEAPPGFDLPEDEAFAMYKCLYGLKQSARKWNKKITGVFNEIGLQQSEADKCVFVSYNKKGDLTAAVAVHVDDILVSGEDDMRAKIKACLKKVFTIKDLGRLSWYLGVKFTWEDNAVYLSQESYTKEILERHRMENCNVRNTPAEKGKLRKPTEEITNQERDWLNSCGKTQTAFRKAVGALRYLADRTRPDIAYAVGQLARHMNDPRREHWVAVKHVFAYLRGTQEFALRFKKDNDNSRVLQKCVGFSDSDHAQCPDTRSSTSGYTFIHSGGAVSWASKKQPVIARSSAEAELVALDLCSREGKWIRKLERTLRFQEGPTPLHEDNEAAIAISEKHQRTQRTKHIDVQYFAICDDVEKGHFEIRPVASADNVSDAFTKGLGRIKFQQFREALGVVAHC